MTQASDQANIVRLYEELAVRPEDGVERLTERYRQRLRQLHPDARFESGPQRSVDDPGAEDGLGWLTRSYREAVGFARIHGRLPGAGSALPPAAAASDGAAGVPERAPVARFEAAPVVPVRRASRSAPPPRRLGWRWLVGASAVVAATLVAMPELLEPPAVTPFNRDLGVAPAGRVDAAPAGSIRVGSSMADVLRIQGAPTSRGDGVWEYGPSFVRFEDGRVRDWHSSPLQPLQVEHTGR